MNDQPQPSTPDTAKDRAAERQLKALAEKIYAVHKETPLEEKEAREHLSEQEQLNRQEVVKKVQSRPLPDALTLSAEARAIDLARQPAGPDQLVKLIQLAHTQGAAYAVAVTRRLRDPYLLDALHDSLAKDEVFRQLTKTGKL